MALNGRGKIYTVVKRQRYCGHRGSGCVDSVLYVLWSFKCPTFSKTVIIALGNSSTPSSRCSRSVLWSGISKQATFSAMFPLFNLSPMNQLKAFMMFYVPLSVPPYFSCLWTLDWLLCKEQTGKEAPPAPGTLSSYLREQRLEKPGVFCVAASLLPQVLVVPVPRRQAPHGLGTA